MKMIRLFVILTFITGVVYPALVTVVSKIAFNFESTGSLIFKDGKVVGSSLFGQKFSGEEFFHSRPSAADYATVASGASQLSPASAKFKVQFEKLKALEPLAAEDMWTTSGSGLDPHISPESAYGQVQRISRARQLSEKVINSLIKIHLEPPFLGIWGRPRVNVLELNMDLLKVVDGNSGTAP